MIDMELDCKNRLCATRQKVLKFAREEALEQVDKLRTYILLNESDRTLAMMKERDKAQAQVRALKQDVDRRASERAKLVRRIEELEAEVKELRETPWVARCAELRRALTP